VNSWNFTGNIGNDAEIRYTAGGDAIANFSVAVKAGYGDKAVTTWVRCSLFGKRADALSQYLVKGSQVGVVGEAKLRPWKDKDGNERQSLEVAVNDLTLLGSKQDRSEPVEQRQSAKPAARKPVSSDFSDMDDDIPF
jgi:single-strand DNA-binding protein